SDFAPHLLFVSPADVFDVRLELSYGAGVPGRAKRPRVLQSAAQYARFSIAKPCPFVLKLLCEARPRQLPLEFRKLCVESALDLSRCRGFRGCSFEALLGETRERRSTRLSFAGLLKSLPHLYELGESV